MTELVPVYDIINCGPRNRFSANGKLVHNCDGMNVQNLPNVRKSNLRKAFIAPKGKCIVVVDSAQIELRMALWFCQQNDRLDILRTGGDLYKVEAATHFPDVAIEDITYGQRQFGKVTSLGCQYGMGAYMFRKYCAAGPIGLDPIYLSEADAQAAVSRYRANNPNIKEMWEQLNAMLPAMTFTPFHKTVRCVAMMHEAIQLPSGRFIQYPNLHLAEDGVWWYGINTYHKLWGGTMFENIIQALARDVIADQLLMISERYDVVSSTHDEVIYLASIEDADEALNFGLECLSQTPDWAEGLPLAAEGGYGDCYSK